jgi:hypothetical protein
MKMPQSKDRGTIAGRATIAGLKLDPRANASVFPGIMPTKTLQLAEGEAG